MRGGDFLASFALVIIPLGHWGRLPWGILGILLNRKGFPIKVTVIGHSLVKPILPSLASALGKYRLCDNILASLSGNTKSIFLKRHFFGKPLSKAFTSQSLPGDSTKADSLFSL